MRGNYIAVFIHVVWATKYRLPILPKNIRYPLFAHIRKHALSKGIDLRIVNGVEDHVHCLFRLLSTQKYAWVIQMLKGESSKWLNETFFSKTEGQKILAEVVEEQLGLNPKYDRYLPSVCDFKWQDGYGALSVSPQNVGTVTRYIFNQEEHHKKQPLEEELKLFQFYADDKNLDG